MNVKVDMAAESLDEGDGTGFEVGSFVLASEIFFIEPLLHRFLDGSCDDRVHIAQDFSLEFGVACTHVAKGNRHGEHPLANDGGFGEYVVAEMCSGFGHPPCSATSAESALFATEGDEAFMFAVNAAKTQESVCQYAALEKGFEFFCYM